MQASPDKTSVLEYRRPEVRRQGRIRSFGEEVAKLALLAVATTWYGMQTREPERARIFLLAGTGLIIGVLVACLLRWLMTRGRAPIGPREEFAAHWRWIVAVLILAAVGLGPAVLQRRYSCWHGDRWYNRVWGIARAPGGPCGNGEHPRGVHCWRVRGDWYVYLAHQR